MAAPMSTSPATSSAWSPSARPEAARARWASGGDERERRRVRVRAPIQRLKGRLDEPRRDRERDERERWRVVTTATTLPVATCATGGRGGGLPHAGLLSGRGWNADAGDRRRHGCELRHRGGDRPGAGERRLAGGDRRPPR